MKNWSSLTPRQIEVLVSEHVFKRTVIWLDRGLGRTPYVVDTGAMKSDTGWSGTTLVGGYLVTGTNDQGELIGIYGHIVDRYMDDMNATWLIVETFTDANISLHYVPDAYTRCNIEWYDDRGVQATGDTPEEAICKAALIAAGVVGFGQKAEIAP